VVLGKTAADDFAYRGNGTSSHTGPGAQPARPHRHAHARRIERRVGGGGGAGMAFAR
jgi:Asp-tRNA(Asn)/Glu-tRNA(Gln) amidotransferase A subunit family amidase